MSLKRRQFLLFLGATAGTATLGSLERSQQSFLGLPQAAAAEGMAFSPLKGPLPYEGLNIEAALQKAEYSEYVVQDDLVLAEGLTYDVIGSWGDPVGDSRFGYNNDYLSFVPTGPDEGYLTINFEYISDATWLQTYPTVVGKSLPTEAVMAAIAAQGEGIEEIDAYGLPAGELKSQITDLCKETLLDQGIGVISIKREPDGRWVRTNSASDRRITGMSGLEDDRYLQVTGPATAVFNKQSGQGYLDGLGSQIIGTFGNCSGGTTPWGTVLSAEENIQSQVPEGVYADGTSLSPSEKPFDVSLDGQGNVLGLAGNKYGWIVEVDPSNANDYGTKHTWLGRFRHEGVGVRVEAGKQLAFYSGCDRRGGHVYKFMSTGTVTDPQDKANSALLADGMLHVAKFNPDGTGQWMALTPSTPVDPVLPSSVVGGLVTLPSRPDGGFEKVEDDAVALSFKSQYATLGDLYEGSELEKQGAILIDAHFAANAAGATSTARPEDTDVRADGTVFIAFTSGLSGGDGGPDKSIFVGPNGEDFEFGWIMKLMEDDSDPAAMTFTWEMVALGGEPVDGGFGFANPDNLEFDRKGNLWLVTDMSTSTHNKPVPTRLSEEGEVLTQKALLGLFGNNSVWYFPLEGPQAGEPVMMGYGPMECEMTGPFFTDDDKTLFLSAQHPGERNGIRQDMAAEAHQYEMKTTVGESFLQNREVPVGSNWPDKQPNSAPKPSVVAVRRIDGNPLS